MNRIVPWKFHDPEISVIKLFEMFPDEGSAREWLENICWKEKRICMRCGGANTRETKGHKTMPYWCTDCRRYFSVRTGTIMESSRIPLRKWVIGIHLMTASKQGLSSMSLHRELGITQKSAWFMLKKVRHNWSEECNLLGRFIEDN